MTFTPQLLANCLQDASFRNCISLTSALLALIAMGCIGAATSASAATITVDSTDDNFPTIVNGDCTFREAIEAATIDSAVDGCTAGDTGADIIDMTGISGIVSLQRGVLILSDVTINGPGARQLVISGASVLPFDQMIRNDSNAIVKFSDVTIADHVGNGSFSSCLTPCQGELQLDRVRVTNCHVFEGDDYYWVDPGFGGAMSTNCTDASVRIHNSTFDDNGAHGGDENFPSRGGAIWWAGKNLTITNSTFSGNSAAGVEAKGGALWLAPNVNVGGTVVLKNVTFSENASAGQGAAIFAWGEVTIGNTALANSINGGNCATSEYGTIVSAGYNLSDDATCGLAGVGDQDNAEDSLGGLSDNGGGTDTHLPSPGNLIDTGDPAGCTDENGLPLTIDQRGFARPVGAACDIGSVEAVSNDADGDGVPNDSDNCPTVPNADQTDSNGDGFGDACVDPGTDIPGSADVHPTVTVGTGSVINSGVIIEENVGIGSDTDVARNSTIGADTTVGSNSEINQACDVGSNVTVGDYVVIDQGVIIEDGVEIQSGTETNPTTIGARAFIGENAVIGSGATIGRDAVICRSADIGTGLSLGRNAFVDSGAVQTTDIGGSKTEVSPLDCTPL